MSDQRAIFGLSSRDRSQKFGLENIWEDETLTSLSRVGQLWHLYMHAWRGLIATPLSSLLTAFTIGGSLALLAGFLLVIENVRSALTSSQNSLGVNVYLSDDNSEQAVTQLVSDLKKRQEVAGATFRSKQQAMLEFRSSLAEYSYLLDGLEGQNPLPASIDLEIKPTYITDSDLRKLAGEISSIKGVERAVYNEGSLSQLTGIMQLLRRIGGCAVLFMLAVTGFIIANTIKLAVAAEQHEIEIMRLVGATESLVQAPFIIQGFIEGVVGAAFGVTLVFAVYQIIVRVIGSSPFLQLFFEQLHFLPPSAVILVVCTGMVVGVGGSVIALRQGRT